MSITASKSNPAARGFAQVHATRIIATTVGVILGLSGMNHGLFEALQGSKPTGGLFIQAIGEAQRFWPLGTEDAFTLVPNFLLTGVLAMLVGLACIVWSLWGLARQHGPTVFLLLFVLLFLVGGGVAQVVFFVPAWALATRMDKPLTWWGKVLPPRVRPFLSRLWPVTLTLSTLALLIGMEIAVFGWLPVQMEDTAKLSVVLAFVLAAWVLLILTFIAGFGHDLRRMEARA